MTDQYGAGACNIGPEEVAMRRQTGHVGVGVTAVLAAALVRSDLRRAWRPGTSRPGSASAPTLGFRGSTNLDARGHEQPGTTDQARAADRRRALRITAASAAVGLGVALVMMSL